MTIPRSEYPRPQFVRNDWLCLNGEWQFEIDQANSGLERGLLERDLSSRITVPFCPESELSGIGNVDYLNAVWYRREISIPDAWAGRKALLHFQAVDYDATIWINGREVCRHRGGFAPITIDLDGLAAPGDTFTLVVRARDDHQLPNPKGKQSNLYNNCGCHYTRTTGIWQTVWLEPVSKVYLKRPRITPDVANSKFRLEVPVSQNAPGMKVAAILKDERGGIAETSVAANVDFSAQLDLVIPQDRIRLWGPGEPNLYDIDLQLLDEKGQVIDQLACYAGLRSITICGKAYMINGEKVFQRQVLDQGYYPDGIMTAPSEEALLADIELSMKAGFNAARLHQKVFEERFLYHADKMGYLVWGEFADWHSAGADRQQLGDTGTFITQWLEVLARDYSHPSIIGWCPMNETSSLLKDEIVPHDDRMCGMYLATKAMDSTRPVLDTSGYSHRVIGADVYDCHDYNQDPASFVETHKGLAEDKPYANKNQHIESVPYGGQPYFVSEFGGIWWNPKAKENDSSWGYGDRPKSIEEFYERFEGLCNALLDNPDMFGYCYTQLTDVFQEQNGIYGFDRSLKFDMDRIAAIQTRKAAFEE